MKCTCTILRTRDKTVSMTSSKLHVVSGTIFLSSAGARTRRVTSELIIVKADILHALSAQGRKQVAIGFILTKFLQEKHASLCGTISDVTQVNMHLHKKEK